ncbi:choline-sulfatase [Candidatus Poriferisodalis sp.]|uniref:choline-sulfatase n=1 Tax=Candidatus Poriferisodalis sp. TaxID=3101277 RepID=UPI003AF4F18F
MTKPNILLVMADQLAPHFTGAYGHPLVQTPAMNALVERGVRFDAAYCNFPLCAPSRFSMLSGQPATAIGAWDNASEFAASVPTLTHYLRLLGYRTTLSGKMHFIGPDQLHGFEARLTTDIYPSGFALTPDWDAAAAPLSHWYNMASLSEAGPVLTNYQHDFDEEAGFAAVRHLYDLARRPSDERPFFLVASFTHPHDPYEARPEWWNLYDPDDIDLPEPIADREIDAHTRRIRHGIGAETPGYTDEQCRNARHGYYANTSYFDSWLGRLVRVLEETGHADDTIVIALSDHGDMLGDRGAFFKMSFFERAARVPLVVAGPGVANCTIPNVCSLVDLLPTILDVATDGAGWPELRPEMRPDSAGRSLWELASGDHDDVDEAIGEYTAVLTTQPMFMIRRGRYKYIHCEGDPALLYDVEADPLERTNLATDPEHAEAAAVFAAETSQRWDASALREQVLASQRARRVLSAAAQAGGTMSWDYSPTRDVTGEYVRDGMDWLTTGRRSRIIASG